MKLITMMIPTLILFLGARSVLAQGDPSAITLVGPTSVSTDDGLETNRYVKKQKKKKSRDPASEDQAAATPATSDAGNPSAANTNSGMTPGPLMRPNVESSEDATTSYASPPYNSQGVPTNPSFGNKMRDLVWGGDQDIIDQYRAYLDAEDIRKNIFEFTVATTYLYDTSMSPYFYRNYIDSSPGASVGLDLWLTPFLGIDADYRGTFLDTIKDSPTQDVYINGTQTWFDLGLRFRRFFGMALNASSLTVGLKYSDYVFSVPPTSLSRMTIHNQAPDLSIDISVPASRCYSWTVGLSLEPYVTSTEVSNTRLNSGSSNQTVGYGASFGGEYRMSRQTRAFFKLSAEVFKSQFTGAATAIDPVSGMTPTNIPVTNVFYMFDLGIRLGR